MKNKINKFNLHQKCFFINDEYNIEDGTIIAIMCEDNEIHYNVRGDVNEAYNVPENFINEAGSGLDNKKISFINYMRQQEIDEINDNHDKMISNLFDKATGEIS